MKDMYLTDAETRQTWTVSDAPIELVRASLNGFGGSMDKERGRLRLEIELIIRSMDAA
jgi:hypothetical protein